MIDDGINLVIRLSGFKLHCSQLTIFMMSSVFSFFQEVSPGRFSIICHIRNCRSQRVYATFSSSSSIYLWQKNSTFLQYINGFFYLVNGLTPLVSTVMRVDGNAVFHFYIGFGTEVWNLQVPFIYVFTVQLGFATAIQY